MPPKRVRVPVDVATVVLTEAGYRCAVPTCRGILALDLHHMAQVSRGGKNVPSNLLALCPTCHALYHRGIIKQESIFVWKGLLVALTRAFDFESIDLLFFIARLPRGRLVVSLDGVLRLARLVAGDLVTAQMLNAYHGGAPTYEVLLTDRGRQLLSAWREGRRSAVEKALRK